MNCRPPSFNDGNWLDEIIPHLVKIIRSSMGLGHIHNSWLRAKVILIPKGGKRDIFKPKSDRPASFTSFILKTMEKVADIYIRTEILKTLPLNPFYADRSFSTDKHNYSI